MVKRRKRWRKVSNKLIKHALVRIVLDESVIHGRPQGHHEEVQGRELRGHENLKWNTDLIETMEHEHVMSQAPQDLDDGETRHDNGKLKLTNVTKCSGRSTTKERLASSTANLASRGGVLEECVYDRRPHEKSTRRSWPRSRPRPPTRRNHKGWRSGDSSPWMSHHPSGSWQGHHGTLGPSRREAVGGPTTRPKCEAANNAAPREHQNREVFRQTDCK